MRQNVNNDGIWNPPIHSFIHSFINSYSLLSMDPVHRFARDIFIVLVSISGELRNYRFSCFRRGRRRVFRTTFNRVLRKPEKEFLRPRGWASACPARSCSRGRKLKHKASGLLPAFGLHLSTSMSRFVVPNMELSFKLDNGQALFTRKACEIPDWCMTLVETFYWYRGFIFVHIAVSVTISFLEVKRSLNLSQPPSQPSFPSKFTIAPVARKTFYTS